MSGDRCTACGAHAPRFREEENGTDARHSFCNSVCQARFRGVFTNAAMKHATGELLEMPSWAVMLHAATLAHGHYHGTWHTHESLREKIVESGASPGDIDGYDSGSARYAEIVREAIDAYRKMDKAHVDPDGERLAFLMHGDGEPHQTVLARMLLTPSLPDTVDDAFESVVLGEIAKAEGSVPPDPDPEDARDARLAAFDAILDTVYRSRAVSVAVGEAVGELIGFVPAYVWEAAHSSPRPDEVGAPVYQINALRLLTRRYERTARSFDHKTTPGLTTITVHGGERYYKSKSIAKFNRLFIEGADPFPFWVAFDAARAIPYMAISDDESSWSRTINALGVIGVYELEKDVEFIDVSNPESVRAIMVRMRLKGEPESLIATVKRAFPIVKNAETGEEAVERRSEFDDDRDLAVWLCANGHAGFASAEIPALPAEVMFCHAEQHLKLVGTVDAKADLGFDFTDWKYMRVDPFMVPDHPLQSFSG